MHDAGFEDHTLGTNYSDLKALLGAMCSHLTCFHFKQGLPPSPAVVCQAEHISPGQRECPPTHFTDEESVTLNRKCLMKTVRTVFPERHTQILIPYF